MFVALMENYGKATELTTLAIESNGTALDRYNNVYLDSTQAKMDSLKATLEGLFLEALTSETINSFIDGATNVLKFIDACGGLIPVLKDIVGLLVIIKSQAIASFAMGVWGNITSIGSTIASAFFGASASVTGLSTALTALNLNPVVLAITALVGGGLLLKNAFDEANVSTAELKNELADLQAKATNMSSLSTEYEELANKTELSAEESARFVEVQNQLKELIPDLSGYYDENGNFIATNTAQIEENTDAILKSIDAKKELIALEGRENIKSEITDVEQYKSSVEELQKYIALKEQVGSTSMMTNDDLINMGISEDDIRILNQYDAMLGNVEIAQSELEVVSKEYANSIDESRQAMIDMITVSDEYSNLTEREQNAVKKAIGNMTPEELIDKWQKVSNNTSGFIDNIIDDIDEMTEEVNDSIEDIDADNVDLSGLGEGIERSRDDIADAVEDINKKVKDLNSIIKELDEHHGISGDSMTKIISEYPDLLQYVDDEATLRQKLSEKMEDYNDEFSNLMRELIAQEENYYNEANAKSEAYYQNKILGNANTCEQITADLESLYASLGMMYSGDLENYKTMEQLKASVTEELIGSLQRAWSQYFSSIGAKFNTLASMVETTSKLSTNVWTQNMKDSKYPELSPDALREEGVKQSQGVASKATKEIADLTSQMSEQYRKIGDALNKYTFEPISVDVGGVGGIGSKGGKGGGGSSKQDDIFKDQIDNIKSQSDAINREIELMYQKIEMAESLGNTETANKLEDDLVKLYGKRKEIIHNQAEDLRKLLTKTTNAEIQADIQDEIASLQDEYHSTQMDIIDQRLERVEEIHEKTLEGLTEELEVLERQRILLNEESPQYLETYRTEYQIILKQIESTEKALNSLRNQGFLEDTDLIKNLKSELSEYQTTLLELTKEFRDALQTQIENTTDSLEEMLDYTIEMIKKETEEKKEALEEEYDNRKEILEKQQELEEKALEDRLDLLKREADARKEALDRESDEKSYNDELAEKQKEIAELENQLSIISLDDSKSKEQKQLRDEIAKKRKELEDFQYERSIELQKQAIDDELSLQEDKIETELDRLEEEHEEQLEYYEDLYESQKEMYEDYLDDEVSLRQEANKRMNLDSKSFYNELKAYVTSYCGVTESEFDEMWRVASEGMELFGNGQKDVLSNLDSMSAKVIALRTQLQSLASTGLGAYLNGTGDIMTDTSTNNNKYNGLTDKSEREEYRDEQLQKLIDLGNAMNGADNQTVASLKAQQQAVASTIGAYMQNGTYYIMINGKKYPVRQAIGVRHSGLDTGEVGNKNGFKIKSNEELNLLEKGELVVTPQQSSNIVNNVKNIANDIVNRENVNLVLDLHDFAITDNNYSDFKSYLTKEIPKVLNSVLMKKGIR